MDNKKALCIIKNVVDNFFDGNYKITIGKDDFNTNTHTYDISVIMGIISNMAHEGLSLNIPDRTKKGDEKHA